MNADLELRTAQMAVGELCGFSFGPQGSSGGGGGIWRAQLGTRWHNEMRAQALAEGLKVAFEVGVSGTIARRGWKIALSGRIDQLVEADTGPLLREIKTVTRPLPAPEGELRAQYPEYFAQLAAYVALRGASEDAQLVFVEVDTGLAQAVRLSGDDHAVFEERIDRVVEFLDLRLRARERLRHLSFRPPFSSLREGQEKALAELVAGVRAASGAILFEAPTGFGKTGILLECALGELKAGHFERMVYLTGKSTGQIHVIQTLSAMTENLGGSRVQAWNVRNKSEHCVNAVFHCVRESCAYLDGAEDRWPASGLSRFYLMEDAPRDVESLRRAGMGARICPYEITRAALTFNDVWIGDYNYVFSPESRRLFYERPGFDPARTLVVIDEAHNLASRVADAHSHVFIGSDARLVAEELERIGAEIRLCARWAEWAGFLDMRRRSATLTEAEQADALDLLERAAEATASIPVDPSELGPAAGALLWKVPAAVQQWREHDLKRLWWSPNDSSLAVTCLDPAPAIAATLNEFGGVVLATATPGPSERFAQTCGLASVVEVRAPAPWRESAYRVAVDLRVDTTFQHRQRFIPITAATVERMHRAAGEEEPIAAFFPSYAYAEAVARLCPGSALQPRSLDLAAQASWINSALDQAQALFLVLGSGFSEGIDLLGGRVRHAIVVGPALPEVNAVQKARMAAYADEGHEEAFDRVYRIAGMQKVNQALGRLVRAPGQSATVLLHCRRFAEPGYERLLAEEYRGGFHIGEDDDLDTWL